MMSLSMRCRLGVTHGLVKPGFFMLAAVHNGDILAAGFTSDSCFVSSDDVDALRPICNAGFPDNIGDLPWICCDSPEELAGFFRKYPNKHYKIITQRSPLPQCCLKRFDNDKIPKCSDVHGI